MPIDQALRLLSILLASVSCIGLVLWAGLPEWLTVLAGSALILALLRTSGLSIIRRMAVSVTLSTATWNSLVIFGFLGFWIDSLWISGDLLHAGIHFLLILMVIKLGNLQQYRDYLHLYAISLVAVLAAASLTADLWYFPIFLIYLLFGVWALLLFQVAKQPEHEEPSVSLDRQSQEEPEKNGRVTPQLFWLANGLAAVTFGLTLVIFFAIPRVGAGFYQKGFGENIRTSGFSNTVDLGAIGPIKRDPSVVMRVELPDRSARDGRRLYLRGSVFDRYNGKSWANLLNHRRSVKESSPGTFAIHGSLSQEASSLGPALRQNILLEPLDTPVLFAASFAETISGKLSAVQADLAGGLYLPFSSSSRIEYSVISRSNPILPADLKFAPVTYHESFLRHYLQIPLQADRIAALTREVVRDKRNTYEKAIAIQDYLLRNYRYSLDAPLGEQEDPLEEFLFNRKTGYCEHYATAMVVMLRTQGIPARLITGFLATEWNEYGNFFMVRQQDAHAWVEIHLPHSGWVTMDPTPASEEGVRDAPNTWQSFGRMLDSVRLRWSRIFVQYSATDQLAMVRGIQASSMTAKNRARDSLTSLVDPLTAMMGKVIGSFNGNDLVRIAGSFFLLAAASLLVWLSSKKLWSQGFSIKESRYEEKEVVRLYNRMIVQLARKGLLKPTTMGPLEFLRVTQEQWADAISLVRAITELYCRGRFGKSSITQEEYRSAQDQLRRLMALDRH